MPVALGAPDLTRIAADFDVEHRRTYGHALPGAPVDLVNVKLPRGRPGTAMRPYARSPASGRARPSVAPGLLWPGTGRATFR